MKSESPKCPKCGLKKVAYHLWGQRSSSRNFIREMELKGYRVELEGCVPLLVNDDACRYTCDSCKHGWELVLGER